VESLKAASGAPTVRVAWIVDTGAGRG
jgi:hypothetical protein